MTVYLMILSCGLNRRLSYETHFLPLSKNPISSLQHNILFLVIFSAELKFFSHAFVTHVTCIFFHRDGSNCRSRFRNVQGVEETLMHRQIILYVFHKLGVLDTAKLISRV